jgi:hypothetical protein
MGFELELLWLGNDGNATVVGREQSPLDLSLAKVKAQQILDGTRNHGGLVDAIRIRDASGEVAFIYRAGGGSDLGARPGSVARSP